MANLRDSFIKYAKRAKDKATPWWSKWWWAVLFGVLFVVIVAALWQSQRAKNRLEDEVDYHKSKAKTARLESLSEQNVHEAAKKRVEASRHEAIAKSKEKELENVRSDYDDLKDRIDKSKDWDALNEAYKELE